LVAVLMVVALLAMLRTTPAQESPLETPASSGTKGAPAMATAYGLLVFMSVVRFLQVAAVGSGVTFFNVYMDDALGVATAQIGLIASLARLVAVPAALFGPLLSRRIGYGAAATAASFVTFLSVLPLALIPNPAAAGVGFIGLMTSTSIRYPAFYVYMMERTPSPLRATMTGAGEMAAGLCFALMSLLGGYMIVRFGYPSAFLLGGAFTLAGTLLFAYYVRTRGEAVAVVAESGAGAAD
jgi:MFS family permease